jgi:hypothetical protein
VIESVERVKSSVTSLMQGRRRGLELAYYGSKHGCEVV